MNDRLHPPHTLVLTTLAMICFAGNSLLCRLALSRRPIDPRRSPRFARVGCACAGVDRVAPRYKAGRRGNWASGAALFAYAAAFSFGIPAGTWRAPAR